MLPLLILTCASTNLRPEPSLQVVISRRVSALRSVGGSELKRKLFPAIQSSFHDAVWLSSTRTAGLSGAIISLRLDDPNSESEETTKLDGILIWRDRGRYACQVLESADFFAEPEDGLIVGGSGYLRSRRFIWCGDASAGHNWEVPMARIYCLGKTRHWRLESVATAKNMMSGYPGTHFARTKSRIDPNHIVAVMRVYPDHLSQAHVGPLLRYTADWWVNGSGIATGKPHEADTALSALNHLAGLAQAGDLDAFNRLVPSQFRERLLVLLKDKIDVSCKGNVQYDDAHDFYWSRDRGGDDSAGRLALHFSRAHGLWRVVRVNDESKN